MPISILNYPVHLQEGLKLNRECVKSQGSQNEDRKVFHRDSLEVSQLSKNREILMDKIKAYGSAVGCIVQRYESWNLKRNQGRKKGSMVITM